MSNDLAPSRERPVSQRFELPEEFNVYGAQDTLQAIRTWLTLAEVMPGDAIEIDAGRVMEIDGTGIQILAALTHSGYRWKLVEASAKFVSACLLTGHKHWLAQTEVSA